MKPQGHTRASVSRRSLSGIAMGFFFALVFPVSTLSGDDAKRHSPAATDRAQTGSIAGRVVYKADEVVFVESSVTRMRLKSVVARITQRPGPSGAHALKAYGAAWDDGTGIQKVQVKVDGGLWQDARLDEAPRARFCWTFFSIDLGTMSPGKHTVISRAIDVRGHVQPAAEDDEIALKKTYWEANQQWPWEIEISPAVS